MKTMDSKVVAGPKVDLTGGNRKGAEGYCQDTSSRDGGKGIGIGKSSSKNPHGANPQKPL